MARAYECDRCKNLVKECHTATAITYNDIVILLQFRNPLKRKEREVQELPEEMEICNTCINELLRQMAGV